MDKEQKEIIRQLSNLDKSKQFELINTFIPFQNSETNKAILENLLKKFKKDTEP